MEFLRSVLASDETITVSTRVTYDLPVNPLSHIIFTLLFANDTSTIGNYSVIAAALAQISNIAVTHKGTSIISASFADLVAAGLVLVKKPVGQVNLVRTNNDVRALSVVIPFGRRLFDPAECFPATKKGELKLVIDYAAAQTGIDTLKAQIETVELPGATPKGHIKITTLTKTPAASGDVDVDLPIGNPIVGCLLFGTTVPNTDYTTTINKVKCKVDNVEAYYSECNWESLHGDFWRRMPYNDMMNKHVHENQDGAVASTLGQENDVGWLDNYAYLDFDPREDDSYLLITEGKARVHLVVNAGDTNALRVLPVELISVGA